jgi:hypothetical protein
VSLSTQHVQEYVLATIVLNIRVEIESIKTIETLTPQVVIETCAIHSSIPIV